MYVCMLYHVLACKYTYMTYIISYNVKSTRKVDSSSESQVMFLHDDSHTHMSHTYAQSVRILYQCLLVVLHGKYYVRADSVSAK
jgi:hypothetical protein